MHSWIQTYMGLRFDPFSPDPNLVDIEDIAHALSNLCRFTGHTKSFYSVAQHCWYVSRNVPEHLALDGLLHDASEAYLNDISRPLKVQPAMAPYRQVEQLVESAVAVRFGLSSPMPKEVKSADRRMLLTERRDLLLPISWELDAKQIWDVDDQPYDFEITSWTPHVAKMQFLTRFEECQKAIRGSTRCCIS